MKRFTQLLRENQIGEWCKRAAWFIALFGAIQIVCFLWGKYAGYINTTSAIIANPLNLVATMQTVAGMLTILSFSSSCSMLLGD